MTSYEKLKEEMPAISKLVNEFPEPVQSKAFDTLLSSFLGEKVRVHVQRTAQEAPAMPRTSTLGTDLSRVAMLIARNAAASRDF